MKNIRFRLPDLTLKQYDIILKSLLYYRNSSVEFCSDTDYTTEIYILLSRIEEKIKTVEK